MALGILFSKPTPEFTVADVGGAFAFVEGDTIDVVAITRENHTQTAGISRRPIERLADGNARVTDHIEADPEVVEITGVVSNTPLGLQALLTSGSQQNLSEDTWFLFKDAIRGGTLFDITTSLQDYTSMAMSSLSTLRVRENANALEFTAVFEKVTLVDAVEVASSVQTSNNTSRKRKATAEAPAAEDAAAEAAPPSLLKSAAQNVLGGFGL